MNLGRYIYQKLLIIFKLDLRSLALFRICLALFIMASFLSRFHLIADYYSDGGSLPRSELINVISSEYWSLNLITGSVFGQQILFIIGIFAAALLLMGYRTQLATIICWVMLLSLHNRNPSLVASSDDILRIVIFWVMFLPLGAYYSCDRALNTSNQPLPQAVISGGTIGFTFQIVLLWIFYFNNVDSLAILLLTLLAFIPGFVWIFLDKQTYSKEISGLVINYDRDCGFCKKVVCFLQTFLILSGVTIREAQANPSIYADMEKYNSWVIEDYRGERYFKWYGIVYVVSISPVLWWLAPILSIKPLMKLGNKIYETIANNRRLIGNFTRLFLFHSQSIQPSSLLNSLAILGLTLTLINYLELVFNFIPESSIINSLIKILRLDT
ncbi:MAG: DCC1-like thiol-disulfide oxidoreductase family protein [Cyanobacteria bacterium P01_G01_bin.67]